jgi:hypothetical protein
MCKTISTDSIHSRFGGIGKNMPPSSPAFLVSIRGLSAAWKQISSDLEIMSQKTIL